MLKSLKEVYKTYTKLVIIKPISHRRDRRDSTRLNGLFVISHRRRRLPAARLDSTVKSSRVGGVKCIPGDKKLSSTGNLKTEHVHFSSSSRVASAGVNCVADYHDPVSKPVTNEIYVT